MIPAILGSSVVQINLLFDTLIASFLITGSISWLYYADRLVEFPLGLLGIALATVILPKLSQDHAKASVETFSTTLDWALRCAIIIGLPAALGLILLAGPVLATLFYGGEFDAEDVYLSSLSLMAYSLGLMGFILVKVLAPGFYARQDTKTPVKIGIKAMIANMGLNIIFVTPLYMMDFKGAHSGLALATATSAYLNAWLLFRTLRKAGHYQPQGGWWKLFAQVSFACLAMGGVLFWYNPPLETWINWNIWTRVFNLSLWITVGFITYVVALLVSGLKLKSLLPSHH
jgi:putative peptidoglycan lipid II flippase